MWILLLNRNSPLANIMPAALGNNAVRVGLLSTASSPLQYLLNRSGRSCHPAAATRGLEGRDRRNK